MPPDARPDWRFGIHRLELEARALGCLAPVRSLLHAVRGTRLLDRRELRQGRWPFGETLLSIAFHHWDWIRWRLLRSLFAHLFARYPAPAWIESAWEMSLRGPDWPVALRCQELCKHVAGGGSLRRAPDLPCPLTRRMAHHALAAPDDLTVGEALRWGQVRGLGGDAATARAIRFTAAGDPFTAPGGEEGQAFWLEVCRFLIAHPELERRRFGPIVGYLAERRFVPVPRADGGSAPAEPGLTLRGRSLQSLLRQVERWHGAFSLLHDMRRRRWPRSGLPGLSMPVEQDGRRAIWSVVELTSSEELAREGGLLRHCVYAYDELCASGYCSIWSVRRIEEGEIERRLTVELRMRDGRIVQARGGMNRLPDDQELRVLEAWARRAGLEIARLLVC